jgi:hypothetical protein
MPSIAAVSIGYCVLACCDWLSQRTGVCAMAAPAEIATAAAASRRRRGRRMARGSSDGLAS